jgi:hypothetical protein
LRVESEHADDADFKDLRRFFLFDNMAFILTGSFIYLRKSLKSASSACPLSTLNSQLSTIFGFGILKKYVFNKLIKKDIAEQRKKNPLISVKLA